jgi:heterodisulfide reductase subunit A-like polyferredoxin
MMAFIPGGGAKACSYGCMGFGSCVKACPFDAIHVVDGIAKVDPKVCKACGKCVAACPKHLIELVPYEAMHLVQCSSKDKGKDVMSACSVGCIGCHLCEKNCPNDAVHVVDNVAYIDQEKCTGCGICQGACPNTSITMHVKSGRFLPVVDQKSCKNDKGCHRCYDICPGVGVKLNCIAEGGTGGAGTPRLHRFRCVHHGAAGLCRGCQG